MENFLMKAARQCLFKDLGTVRFMAQTVRANFVRHDTSLPIACIIRSSECLGILLLEHSEVLSAAQLKSYGDNVPFSLICTAVVCKKETDCRELILWRRTLKLKQTRTRNYFRAYIFRNSFKVKVICQIHLVMSIFLPFSSKLKSNLKTCFMLYMLKFKQSPLHIGLSLLCYFDPRNKARNIKFNWEYRKLLGIYTVKRL